MEKENIKLEEIRQVFSKHLNIKEPSSTKIPTFELVTCMVFHFASQAKDSPSIESLRRSVIEQTCTPITPSAFHERLNTEKLSLILYQLFLALSKNNLNLPLRGQRLSKVLNVKDILVLDSSSFSLPDSAASVFPGSFTKSALKLHYCFSLLSGSSPYSDYSPASEHDVNYLPDFSLLKGKLLLFDLGYYCFPLFKKIEQKKGFFFSRAKEGSALEIVSIAQGLPDSCIGKRLSEIEGKKFYKQDIDALVEIKQKKKVFRFRLVGFYNKKEGRYHFYLTNLKTEVKKLRKLYNLRWQGELLFKGKKQSLGFEKCTSKKVGIILNLFFASLIAQTLATTFFQIRCCEIQNAKIPKDEKEEKMLSISFQRVYLNLNLLCLSFKNYILEAFERKPSLTFPQKLMLFLPHFSDPYKKRKNSLSLLSSLIL